MKEKFEYFECQKCGAIISIDVSKDNEKKTIYPLYCDEKQGGCGSVSKFLRLKKEYVNERQSNELDKKILGEEMK
ncbi:MAG: hypothetical protein MUO82_07780 [Candidatus Thermoplasmatota archaeon]|nr:hypothetical protein [Candidatus Thermoplasmatota archaeon]